MNTNPTAIIETKDLRKSFPSKVKGQKTTVEAVRGLNFQVNKGEIFGLLGPNGAGKTTTMRMLSTLLSPSGGKATIAGHDLRREQGQIRQKIGYVSQVGGMQREVTGRENLLLQARLYGMSTKEAKERVEELLEALELTSFADRNTATYSGGQRRIFDLAAGIIHEPDLLFLDEPSTGLDPQNRAQVWAQVKELRDRGTSIFVTTHYLEEADALCDRVAIVDKGGIVAIGTPDELKRQIAGDIITLGFADEKIANDALEILAPNPLTKETQIKDKTVHAYVEQGDENLPAVLAVLHEKQIAIKSIQLSRPTLDDVFLKLTGRSLQESESKN